MAGNCSAVDLSVFTDSKDTRDERLNKLGEAKIGVKEVVDSGITKVPDIFIVPEKFRNNEPAVVSDCHYKVPVIDLQGFQSDRRSEIVSELKKASSTWGMFVLKNHVVPHGVIQHLLDSIQTFNEQPLELKREFYTGDTTKTFRCYTNIFNGIRIVSWKDSVFIYSDYQYADDLQALPSLLRKPISDYRKCVTELKDILSELLSEALGLRSDYLKTINCMKHNKLIGHYYPACPDPSLTMGALRHSDAAFLTIVLQNHIDGLQVLHDNQWINVHPSDGALVVNIGDMLQLVSNDIFKSAIHRVTCSSIGPRLSVATFFSAENKDQVYEPIKELLQGNAEPVYRGTSVREYFNHYLPKQYTAETAALSAYRQ